MGQATFLANFSVVRAGVERILVRRNTVVGSDSLRDGVGR